jgi:thiamine-monophosphate kinase
LHPDPDLEAHLDPKPNLGLGLKLAAMPEVHACLDLSDGLSRDLRNLADASGLSILVAPDLDGDALEGGEDYARCFGSDLPQAELERRLERTLLPVGRAVNRGEAPLLVYDGNAPRALPDLGFDHFAP